MSSRPLTPTTPDHDVLIIGTGFAGLGMAIQLLKAGRRDFVVLEKDPHDVPPNEIMNIKVNRTVIGGKTVYPKAAS